jgi:hypothetical protein
MKRKQKRLARERAEADKRYRRQRVDRLCSPDVGRFTAPFRRWWGVSSLRRRYFDEVNDPAQLPKPRPPKPPRREKRGQSKPR